MKIGLNNMNLYRGRPIITNIKFEPLARTNDKHRYLLSLSNMDTITDISVIIECEADEKPPKLVNWGIEYENKFEEQFPNLFKKRIKVYEAVFDTLCDLAKELGVEK